MTLGKEKIDLLLGITKPQTPHDFVLNERVKTNKLQRVFQIGRLGTVVGFDEYNLVVVRLDLLPRSTFTFHPTHLDRLVT